MAYNTIQQRRRVSHVVEVYNSVKQYDVPDSYIVRHIFPKHGIYISYRQWMNYKSLKWHDLEVKDVAGLQ